MPATSGRERKRIVKVVLGAAIFGVTSYLAAFYIAASGYWLTAYYIESIWPLVFALVVVNTFKDYYHLRNVITGFITGAIVDECMVRYLGNGDWSEPSIWPTIAGAVLFAVTGILWRAYRKRIERTLRDWAVATLVGVVAKLLALLVAKLFNAIF